MPHLPARAACCGALLACCFVIAAAPSRGHEPDEIVPLDQHGSIAPFAVGETYTEVWGVGNQAFLGSLSSGVAVIDTTDRAHMSHTATFDPAGGFAFYDVQAAGDVGFFSSLGGGTYVVDIRTTSALPVVAQINSSLGGFDNVRNAALVDGYLYQVDTASSQIAVFDVRNPVAPQFVTRIETSDTVGLNNVTVAGGRLYATGIGGLDGENPVYIYDIGDIAQANASYITRIRGGTEIHAAAPIHDGTRVLTTDLIYGGNLSLWDMAELADPDLILFAAAPIMNLDGFSPADVVVLNDTAYVPWFGAGLQVIDLDTVGHNGGFAITGESYTTLGLTAFSGPLGTANAFVGQGHDQVLAVDVHGGVFAINAIEAVHPLNLPGDYDDDGVIDNDDLMLFASTFGSATDLRADGDGSGIIDPADFVIWNSNRTNTWQPTLGPAVPEPTSLAIATLLLIGCSRWRKRSGTGDGTSSCRVACD